MSKIVKVANPIYDVVFKYLMEDTRIAKLLISALIELEVIEIELKPKEYTTDLKEKNFTVYRIDFKAKIKDKNGKEHIVLIELQKAKLATDIMRFRRYLGMQYAHKDNVIKTNKGTIALPIISIYFLGYSLDNFSNTPIIKVARQYIDHATKDILKGKEHFIESLTHDSIIIQIQAIKKKRHRTKLEQVLSVFEQSDVHEVDVNIEKYPKEFQEVIRRLTSALADPDIREVMNIEDDILEELADKERLVEKLAKQKEEIEKEKEIEKQRAEKEKQRAEAEKQRAEKEKQRAKAAMIKLAKRMKKYGENINEIQKETGLSFDEIEKL